MSVPYQRISDATTADIEFYDPAAERRAATLGISWDDFFQVGSQEILYMLEFSWWPKYVENVWGATYYQSNSQGQIISAFDPDLLVKSDQTLIRLDVFKAVEQFYATLVTDVSNVNEVDRENYKYARQRYVDEYDKAVQLSNFYDLYEDGTITKLEENWQEDPNYFNGDRRYF